MSTLSQRIRRPRNAWVIFRQVKSKEYRETHPEQVLNLPEMSKAISEQWAVASEEVKQHYHELANQEHQNLLAIHPDYKYQPRKKGTRRKQKKTSTVKEGGVTKPRATKKKTVSTSATDLELDVHGSEWPEANTPAPDFNNFGEAGPAVAPNDQYAAIDFNHFFYDNTIFPPDTFGVGMPDHAAQSMAYYGQPFVDPSPTLMEPSVTFQLNAYQYGSQMAEGYTPAYDDQPHTSGGSFQPSNIYGTNILYEQTAEPAAAAAEPSGAYATAYSDEGDSGYSSPDITTVDVNGWQELDVFWGWHEDFQNRWARSVTGSE